MRGPSVVVLAWDLIHDSDALDRIGEASIDARRVVERDLLDYTLQLHALHPLWYGGKPRGEFALAFGLEVSPSRRSAAGSRSSRS